MTFWLISDVIELVVILILMIERKLVKMFFRELLERHNIKTSKEEVKELSRSVAEKLFRRKR